MNLVYERMKTQLKDYKDKLEQAQGDLSAWKFTPDRLASLESTSQTIDTLTSSTLYSYSVVMHFIVCIVCLCATLFAGQLTLCW